jgi:hypothetical protein
MGGRDRKLFCNNLKMFGIAILLCSQKFCRFPPTSHLLKIPERKCPKSGPPHPPFPIKWIRNPSQIVEIYILWQIGVEKGGPLVGV